ncbi:MAG TPA: PD-(D/E)XK nuclease family protein [Dehalococcoidia bacterium]|nr:PD-(D/E)XK nuclease family protein [Dehalococcoidia bacterium]
MPPAEIVTGALPELEDALADAVAEARRRDPLGAVTVLVDNVLLRPYLGRTLALRGVPLLNVHIVRPHELAERLAPSAAGDAPRLAPNAARLLAREIAGEAGGYFAAIAGRDGFADALYRLFRELELSGFTAGALGDALEAASTAPMGDGEKLRDLAQLYGRYRERLGAFAAPADAYTAADIAAFEGPLFIYGVWSPEEVQATLIERIAGGAPVTLFLASSGGVADEAHAELRARFGAAGAAVRRLSPAPVDPVPVRMARALFASPAQPIDAAGGVALVSAPDTVREVWEAARACLGWTEDGVRFHEMCVAYRNRDPYAALVGEIFTEAGIETYVHDGRRLAAHPLGRRLLALLELAADGSFSRAAVMEFLTETRLSPGLRARYRGVHPSAWETYTREAGVVEDAAQWDGRLALLAGEKREAARREGQEWQAEIADRIDDLRAFARDFHTALAARPEEATWEEHLAWLRTIAAEYAIDTEPIVEALDDLRTLATVAPRVPCAVFARAVRDDLESRDASRVLGEPVRQFGKRGVAVLDASSLRHLRFRCVYMLGVSERAWPPPSRPDPLLLEHERRAINAAGGGRVPLRTQPDDEALTFWLGAQAAGERLVISVARADAGGGGRHLPSYFFRAAAEAIEGRRLAHDEIDAAGCVRRLPAGRLVSRDLDAALSRAEYDRGLVHAALSDDAGASLAALERVSPPFGRAIAARGGRWSNALTPFDGVMTAAAADALAASRARIRGGAPVSPSRLESYATCPYRFFLRYGLGIEPVEEPESVERIDALERGSLVHAILERFLREIGRDDPPSAARREAHLDVLMRVAHEEEESRERRGVTGRPLMWQMDRRQIEEDLARWYDVEVRDAGDGLQPGAFEVSFGPVTHGPDGGGATISSEQPLALSAGGRELLLQGRIDRIDWDDSRSRFRVIDYKTGRARGGPGLDHGRALQLPIYVHAAARLLGMDPAAGEAQYFYVSSRGGFKRRTIRGEALVEGAADLEQVLTTIADGVDAGMFAPNPGKGKPTCKWCDYKEVCDARIDSIMQRKGGDGRAAAYRALEEIT